MIVTRHAEAKVYAPKAHFDMSAFRLQGHEASPSQAFWVGLSVLLPGGGAERSASPTEKVYVVLEGEITVSTAAGDVVLGPLDSCWIAPNEERSVQNRSESEAKMLVISPY